MANLTKKRRGQLTRGVLEVLVQHSSPLPVRELVAELQKIVPPNEYEKTGYSDKPSDTRYDKFVRFLAVGLVKAGWLIKTKGIWQITDEGKRAYSTFKDPERFEDEVHRLYRAWASSQPEKADGTAERDEPEGDAARRYSTVEEAEESAWREIEHFVAEMGPYDFQDFVAALLRAMGYHVMWKSPPGKDGGLDIIAHSDPLGLTAPRIKVQVKRRGDRIGVDDLRAFLSLLGDQDIGIFICTGGFTADAEALGRSQERRRVTLVDLERLFDLWVEHYDHVKESDKMKLPLRTVSFLAPES